MNNFIFILEIAKRHKVSFKIGKKYRFKNGEIRELIKFPFVANCVGTNMFGHIFSNKYTQTFLVSVTYVPCVIHP